MSSIYARGSRLWMRVKVDGVWVSRATPYTTIQRAQAQRYATAAQDAIDKREQAGAPPVADTVRAYALGPWLDARREAGHDWTADRGRLENHVLDVLGDLPLADVRASHIADLVRRLRFQSEPRLAPRTVRNIYTVVAALFRDATIAGLIETNPCILTAAQLGRVADKDPEWRAGALFTRDEAETLISDPRIPLDRRVVYGLGLLAGLRPGEGAALRLRHYERELAPLGRLLVATAYSTDRSQLKRTKTEAVRGVPVHPALAELLELWLRAGWSAMVGREPGPDDLLIPLPPETAERRTSRTGEPFRGWDYTGRRWREQDLPMLGWRRRSVYDTRATFISLAVEDGADERILRDRVTHTKPRRDAFDGYNRLGPAWAETCAEVAKLRIAPRHGLPAAKSELAEPLAIPSRQDGRKSSRGEALSCGASAGSSIDEGSPLDLVEQVAPLATPLATSALSSSRNVGSGGGSRTPGDVVVDHHGSRRYDEDGARIKTDHDRWRDLLVASFATGGRR